MLIVIYLASKNSSYAFIPAPSRIQPSDTMKLHVYSCDPTTWHHLKTVKSSIHKNTMWEHDLAWGEAQHHHTYALRNLDEVDVEIPAQKGPQGSLRSGPWACRKPCHESLPSSILKLASGFFLLPLLFRKLLYLTLRLFLMFAFMYLHAIWVNSWLSNMYLWLIDYSLYTQA